MLSVAELDRSHFHAFSVIGRVNDKKHKFQKYERVEATKRGLLATSCFPKPYFPRSRVSIYRLQKGQGWIILINYCGCNTQ